MRPARVLNFILICAHSKIRIAEARVGFKAANRESFLYIMHIIIIIIIIIIINFVK